jgi:hypothetical protein
VYRFLVTFKTNLEGHKMMKRSAVALAIGTLFVGLNSAFGSTTCVPVQGKITNNFIAADATLGVVAMEYGAKHNAIKLKCALAGAGQQVTPPADVHFIHTISCDDKLISVPAFDGSGEVPVHSSIVLDTTGNVLPPVSATELFRFTETSVPIVGVGARGLFYGVTGGQINVQGIVYKSSMPGVPGPIDMTFSGEACYAA